jgi:F-type H+-transporting ATPase subunit epsilon
VAIANGFAEALADRVTVLAQMAERAEEIDVTKAKAAQDRAEQRLAAGGPMTDVEAARESLAKASTRLLVASKARTR